MASHTELAPHFTVPPPSFDLAPEHIEFGKIVVPAWLTATYRNGRWGERQIGPIDEITLNPAALVLHYGQSVFEGLKAYLWEDGSVNLFRPYENARRLARSAVRMEMPPVDEKEFVEGIRALIGSQRGWIPRRPGSLYIRPILFGTEPYIGVRASQEFLYYVITLPSGGYFSQLSGKTGTGAVRVYVTTSVGRACPGGTGNIKASANYAVSLKVIQEARARGCGQVLFLDSRGQGLVEEMGGMNVCFVREGRLVTPPLNDTILPGVTRDSILKLAAHVGYAVEETPIAFAELVEGIRKGTVTEGFACGTAAVVVGINSFLLDTGEEVRFGDGECGPVTLDIYERLTGIQYGSTPDPFGWIVKV
jgi:branched-chain amino acid aminotransferase